MRFVKPFTPPQRQLANSIYRSLKASLDDMRFSFPPETAKQQELLREFKRTFRDFRHLLYVKDAKVNVDRLNSVIRLCETLVVDYSVQAMMNSEPPTDA